MESIKELRTKLQEEKIHPHGWSRPIGYKTFQRGPSIYITRILIPTGIQPTTITKIGLLVGFAGCALVLSFDWQVKLAGLALLYLYILSDKVDGELARYHNTFSLRGIYWDEVGHLVIPPLFWLAFAFGTTHLSVFIYEIRYFFGIALAGALSLAAIRMAHSLPAQIFAKKYLKHPEYFPITSQTVVHPKAPHKMPKKILGVLVHVLNTFQDFFVIILMSAVLLVLEQHIRPDALFHPMLVYFVYIESILLVLIALEVIFAKSRRVESDIRSRALDLTQP